MAAIGSQIAQSGRPTGRRRGGEVDDLHPLWFRRPDLSRRGRPPPLGLAFDAWLFHTQLDDVADLARAFPQAMIVLNHVGGALAIGPYSGKREEAFAEWRDGIRQVASFPNTYVKLGGLGMKLTGFTFFENDMPPSSEDLEKAWRPYIETCINAFGPQRSMFESNFPVDKGMCSYPVMWNAFKRIAAGCSADEKTALFSGAAKKAYHLPL